MKFSSLISLCVSALVLTASAKPVTKHHHHHKPPAQKAVAHQTIQPLDHFGGLDNRTIPIRYWVNSTFYKPGGPVLLVNNGEAAVFDEDVAFLFGSTFGTMAKSLNAAILLFEHRYYGDSHPPLSEPVDYRYLTVNQSLADMAAFIKSTGKGVPGIPHDLTPPKTKWITRGGSYSGMLSAWMRYAYPDLVFATISSSAPVEAQLPYWEYLNAFVQYGPQDCVAAMHNVVDYIDGFFASNPTDKQKAALKAQFGVGASTDDLTFVGNIPYLPFMWQSTSPVQEPVDAACKQAFQGAKTVAQQVKGYATYFKGLGPQQPLNHRSLQYQLNRQHMTHHRQSKPDSSNTTAPNPYDDMTLWTYQTCVEFGYDQTVPPPKNSPWYNKRVMSNMTTADMYVQQCQQQFPGQVPSTPATGLVNQYFQGWHLSMTNTIWVNGEWDPWRWLSVASLEAPARTNTSSQYSLLLPHGVHCFDYYNYPGYQNSITNFVNFATATLKSWLGAKSHHH
ncbi:peptidase S28 [Hesseltinella vesiculosa]|uniref:Peptidase S28 n=1 Tax=Hesseltinella vesiculosa TaxID=101127 RepID=A0A1X2G676_9FUNG|nr:peptidase S28 [Hesseltinella vesiculosa]